MNQLQLSTEQLPKAKLWNGQRVVTFKDIDTVHQRPDGTAGRNFRQNKKYFIDGIDFIQRNSSEAKREYNIIAPNGLTLLTESGYLMVVKSFTDDLSWQVQRQLVNNYFRAREPEALLPDGPKSEIVPVAQTYSPLSGITLSNPIGTLETLLTFARQKNLKVMSQPFTKSSSRILGNRIGIATNLSVENVCCELAYELSHAMLHPGIDVLASPNQEEYNRRAWNAACMLLDFIEHTVK